MSDIPEKFDETFLRWFKETTEAGWEKFLVKDPLTGNMVPPTGWREGTKWKAGASDADIARMEAQWNIKFPADYKLFLRTLWTTTLPRELEKYLDGTDHPTLVEEPSFNNYLEDTAHIQKNMDALADGLVFDVENNDLWLDSWGEQPGDLIEQKNKVKQLVKQAPRLIPIFAHRYLLIDPCVPGNPVFSIKQGDIICYGENLHDYLINECFELLEVPEIMLSEDAQRRIEKIPFWGELYKKNNS